MRRRPAPVSPRRYVDRPRGRGAVGDALARVPPRSRPHVEMARSLRDAVAWLESRVGTLRGGATVFALALAVFGVRSIALPVIPGRDFGTYIGYYVQMWDWHSVVPMSQLYRTPLAPLVIGGTLDLLGGWGLEVVMALLFAASVVAWTRTAFAFGPRAALLTAVALLVYPGYGILFHTPASEPVAAAAFAAWGLAVARAWVAPTLRTIRGRRRSDCGGRARAPGIPGPRARLGAAPPPSHALGRTARVRRRVRRRRARGPGLVDSRERAPLRRLHRGARDRGVLPVLSRLHDRPHRPSGQRARLAGARRRGETGRAARGALPLVRDHPRRVLRARRAARVRGRGRDHRPTLGMGLGLRAHACRRHRGGQGASAPVRLRCGEDDLRGAVEAALRRSPERRRRSAERPGAAERDVAAGDRPPHFRSRRTER